MSPTPPPHFSVVPPSAASLAADYDRVEAAFDAALTDDAFAAAVEGWDGLRRRLHTWRALAELRFRQDTGDPEAEAARAHAEALRPQVSARETAIKRRLLDHPRRPELERRFGSQAFRLWELDARAYAPEIDDDLIRESSLKAEYNRLLGGISVDFDGRRMTLAELGGYAHALDRNLRHAAARLRWEALERRGGELDRIYAEQVGARDRMGRKLGHGSFVPLGYARMHRVGYDADDVARWRDAVVAEVVPLAMRIVERSADRRGYGRVMAWDEVVLFGEQTKPVLDGPQLVRELPALLGAIDPRLGEFGTVMRDRELLDLFARPGKGPGGFCTSFETEGYPFIFATFNGAQDDVRVLLHEMGHAFQWDRSKGLPLQDYLQPTLEAAEIDSMGLEFLAWPALEIYFGPHAESFRREHLAGALLFLPYGCAIDHFQHLVYERPDASPDERRAMWREMERRYLPWRAWGDLAYPAAGNAWQQQLHLYTSPFYYIDYTLAQCCALQLWALAERDRGDALERYVGLCELGGSRSLGELIAAAGLESPFEGKALRGVVAAAERYLGARGLA